MGQIRYSFFILVAVSLIWASFARAEGQSFVYDDKGSRDPLWPLVGSAGNVITYDTSDYIISDLVLEGIMSGGSQAGIAMINGKIVGVNDKIGQYVVVQIEKEMVLLKKGDQTYTLRLKKEE